MIWKVRTAGLPGSSTPLWPIQPAVAKFYSMLRVPSQEPLMRLGANSILAPDSGTLFARFRFDQTGNANFGFSDVAAPAAYNDFEAQINRQNGTPIKARDATGFQDLSVPGDFTLADDVDVW